MGRPRKPEQSNTGNERLPFDPPFTSDVPVYERERLLGTLTYFLNELIPWMENPRVKAIRSIVRALSNDAEDEQRLFEYKERAAADGGQAPE